MTHTTAAILSIGDELATGATLDTNARWLAERLSDAGLTVVEHATVADDAPRLAEAMRRLARGANLLVSTGGLGPTADDLTRSALAAAMGVALVEDDDALAGVRAYFERLGRAMPERNRVQALRPEGARCLDNDRGTAPGLAARVEGADVFCLPGPPREMHAMFGAHVAPAVRAPGGRVVRRRVLRSFGLGESDVAERLGELMERDRNPLVGTTVSGGVVSVRIRYEGPGEGAEGLVDGAAALARERVGAYVFGEGDESLAGSVLSLLRGRGERVATVESCTGGLVSAMLTSVPGSSDASVGGWVTYTNEMKTREVGVPASVFGAMGAVSAECAHAMARGGLERAGVDHGVAITGIAGPGGGSDEKPVGTVWIARASSDGSVDVREFRMPGDREGVRRLSAMSALAMLRLHLVGASSLGLLRQRS